MLDDARIPSEVTVTQQMRDQATHSGQYNAEEKAYANGSKSALDLLNESGKTTAIVCANTKGTDVRKGNHYFTIKKENGIWKDKNHCNLNKKQQMDFSKVYYLAY